MSSQMNWNHLQVTTSQVCIGIPTVRSFKVALAQDAMVMIYDYHEPRKLPSTISVKLNIKLF